MLECHLRANTSGKVLATVQESLLFNCDGEPKMMHNGVMCFKHCFSCEIKRVVGMLQGSCTSEGISRALHSKANLPKGRSAASDYATEVTSTRDSTNFHLCIHIKVVHEPSQTHAALLRRACQDRAVHITSKCALQNRKERSYHEGGQSSMAQNCSWNSHMVTQPNPIEGSFAMQWHRAELPDLSQAEGGCSTIHLMAFPLMPW